VTAGYTWARQAQWEEEEAPDLEPTDEQERHRYRAEQLKRARAERLKRARAERLKRARAERLKRAREAQ